METLTFSRFILPLISFSYFPLFAATYYEDGSTHNVAYPVEGPVMIDFRNPNMGTIVNWYVGASIVNHIRPGVAVYNDGAFNMYGGKVNHILYTFQRSIANIYGGEIYHFVDAGNDSTVNFYGGVINDDLLAVNRANVYMYNGLVKEDLEVRSQAHGTLYGGVIDGRLIAGSRDTDEAELTIIGTDFKINGHPVNYGTFSTGDFSSGTLSGVLSSGDDLNNHFKIIGYSKIILAPVEPINLTPIANAGEDQTVYAWIDGYAEVQLDGTGSYDPDGDELEYYWYDRNNLIATDTEPNVLLPIGEHVIDLIVNDGTEDSEPNSCVVTVLPAIEIEAKLTPQALNRNSNQPHVIGRLKLPGLSEADLDPNEMMVLMPGNIEAARMEILPANEGAESISLMGFFDHAALMEAVTEDGDVEVQIATKLISGQWIYGRDIVNMK